MSADVDRYIVRMYRVVRVEEEAFINIEVKKGTPMETVENIAYNEAENAKWERKDAEVLDIHFCDAMKP